MSPPPQDQRITLELQQIDENFSEATKKATGLLGNVRLFTGNMRKVHGSLHVWKPLFNAFSTVGANDTSALDASSASSAISDSSAMQDPNALHLDVSTGEGGEGEGDGGEGDRALNGDAGTRVGPLSAQRHRNGNASLSFTADDMASLRSVATPPTPSFRTSFAKTPAHVPMAARRRHAAASAARAGTTAAGAGNGGGAGRARGCVLLARWPSSLRMERCRISLSFQWRSC